MIAPSSTPLDLGEIRLLAQFRSAIRRFLQFSEQAAMAAGLEPQQHQLLVQIAGAPEDARVTISYIAQALSLRHHTVVELSKRSEQAGLIRRIGDPDDRRFIVLELTPRGEEALAGLSVMHAQQLRELAPGLIQALTRIGKSKS